MACTICSTLFTLAHDYIGNSTNDSVVFMYLWEDSWDQLVYIVEHWCWRGFFFFLFFFRHPWLRLGRLVHTQGDSLKL